MKASREPLHEPSTGAFNPVRNSLVEKALTPQLLNARTTTTVPDPTTRPTQVVQRDSLDMPINHQIKQQGRNI